MWRISTLTEDGTAKPVSRDQILRRQGGFRISVGISTLTGDGTVKPVSRDQIIRRERGFRLSVEILHAVAG